MHRLLGIPIDDAVHVMDVSLALRGGVSVVWVVLLGLVLGAAVVWMYRRAGEGLSSWRRHALAGLRVAFVGLILVLLLRPVLAVTTEAGVRRTVALLLDDSASMRLADVRVSEADRVRAGIAVGLLDASGGLEQAAPAGVEVERVARGALLREALVNEQLGLLRRLEEAGALRAFAFGNEVRELDVSAGAGQWLEQLSAEAPSTAGGDAVEEVLRRLRGQPLAGIVMAWDGQSNSGVDVLAAAERARREGVPLYVYGMGITDPRDISIRSVLAPEVAFAGDEVTAVVRLRGQGLAGQESELVLSLDGQPVAQESVTFDGHEQAVEVRFTPEQAGELDLIASIESRADEAEAANNSMSHRMRVIDEKIKVLYMEHAPRWEFRYLQAMLLRDPRVELKNVLVEGDAGLADEEGSPYLPAFPSARAELMRFDLVFLGDVDPAAFTAAQLDSLAAFVEELGGGLLVLPGRRHGVTGWRGTPLERLLPVELPGMSESDGFDVPAEQAMELELTAAGQRSMMMRLAETPRASEAVWGEMPGVYWRAQVGRAKPAAEVLLVDASAGAFGRSRIPVIAIQRVGSGQVLLVGTDNTWRWRRVGGDVLYSRLWGQMVQRLAMPQLLGETRRTQLSSDQRQYGAGEAVTVYARLHTEAFEPIVEPLVRGELRGERGVAMDVQLRPMPGQPGLYRGELVAPGPGSYRFTVETDEQAELAVEVGEPRLELAETAMNEAVMRQMAERSGGRFFREEELYLLPEMIDARQERVRSLVEVELGGSPLYFLLMLSVVTGEWVLRKLSQLK